MRHSRVLAATVAVWLAATTAACGAQPSESGAPDSPAALTVLGAASTRVLNDDLNELTDDDLTFVNAGSSALVQQLADGAPGDVLVTADAQHMDRAVEAGLVRDPEVIATNSMVLVVPKGNPAGIATVQDVSREDVHLVLCDAQVPCGAVAQELLRANSIDARPVSLEHNVADTLGKVATGEADAGVVYRTDAEAATDAVEVIDIPHADEHPNSLVAGVVITTEHPEHAARLVSLLDSTEAAPLWEKHGFTPAP